MEHIQTLDILCNRNTFQLHGIFSNQILCRFEASELLTEEDNKRIDMMTRRRGNYL